jgi:hypothetical protein
VSDRELLELAAKAAGCGYGEWTRHGIVFEAKDAVWNPLNDDGDALRLAVKLNLDIRPSVYDCDTTAVFVGGDWDGAPEAVHELFYTHGTDPYAATRRAITSAAAEIGRNMK